jgi:hypothetical protein
MNGFREKLIKKADEVYLLKPNNLGNGLLNTSYHHLVSYLKIMPFIYLVPLSVIATVTLYILFGPLLVKLTTLLQHGF